ncbi:hypothetical protein [Ornithinimicrobium sp. W1665]|uniref:hypothetical protein n=1 Tax=Ornithinimicrobium sp. W1665 TaxID=3416666 RepID=UPI003CE9A61F
MSTPADDARDLVADLAQVAGDERAVSALLLDRLPTGTDTLAATALAVVFAECLDRPVTTPHTTPAPSRGR